VIAVATVLAIVLMVLLVGWRARTRA